MGNQVCRQLPLCVENLIQSASGPFPRGGGGQELDYTGCPNYNSGTKKELDRRDKFRGWSKSLFALALNHK